MTSGREISAVQLYDYGHAVAGLTRRIDASLAKCYHKQGKADTEAFRELQDAIRELHDLLSQNFQVPASFSYPPTRPLTSDEIPF
jgi:hypothetical protein